MPRNLASASDANTSPKRKTRMVRAASPLICATLAFRAEAQDSDRLPLCDTGNMGRDNPEQAQLGLRGAPGQSAASDISPGPRDLTPGTGTLISNGAISGSERGTLKLAPPRKACEKAVIGTLNPGGLTTTALYIDPNELP